MTIPAFRALVWRHYRAHGRHDLPWRRTKDPYRILVSEIMLQQTQVGRVRPFYDNFLKKFPTAGVLAKAPLAEVLRAWQGLGYNRRAKMLRAAAKEIAERGMPRSAQELEALPGVGPYTASAVAAFAFGEERVFIETNIRTAVLHHFFPRKKKVSDAEVEKILAEAAPKGKAREWGLALMDYGSFLKGEGIRLNSRSKHYAKQKAFAGSSRQARGAILKELAKENASEARLKGLLGDDRKEQLAAALAALEAEGFVGKSRGRWELRG